MARKETTGRTLSLTKPEVARLNRVLEKTGRTTVKQVMRWVDEELQKSDPDFLLANQDEPK